MADDVRGRHDRYTETIYGALLPKTYCVRCIEPWPCDAIRALDALDAAEADAERLAEALEEALGALQRHHGTGRKSTTWCCLSDEPGIALVAHEARTRG